MLREMNIVDLFKFRDIKPRQKFNLFSKWNELDGEEGTDLEFPIKGTYDMVYFIHLLIV
jgi:hypothetical protein